MSEKCWMVLGNGNHGQKSFLLKEERGPTSVTGCTVRVLRDLTFSNSRDINSGPKSKGAQKTRFSYTKASYPSFKALEFESARLCWKRIGGILKSLPSGRWMIPALWMRFPKHALLQETAFPSKRFCLRTVLRPTP